MTIRLSPDFLEPTILKDPFGLLLVEVSEPFLTFCAGDFPKPTGGNRDEARLALSAPLLVPLTFSSSLLKTSFIACAVR